MQDAMWVKRLKKKEKLRQSFQKIDLEVVILVIKFKIQ